MPKPALDGTAKMWEGWVVAPFSDAFAQAKPPLAREPLRVKLCLVGRQYSGHCAGPHIALEQNAKLAEAGVRCQICHA